MSRKNVYIIAGPNGSGKTTFARKFLPEYAKCSNFINADLIAEGLSPFSPQQVAIKAGRLVLEQIHELSTKNADFGFETTLSGKTYLKHFLKLKEMGYSLHMFFLWIPSTQLAVARVRDRVAEGGHNVPKEDVKRRFYRSILNFFNRYQEVLDSWLFFDNSNVTPELLAKKTNNSIHVLDAKLFNKILNEIEAQL